MRLTLKSMETEMHSIFSRLDNRMTNLETEMKYQFSEVHQRIDRLSLSLESHRKETDCKFRKIDERFDRVDERFDRMDQRFKDLETQLANLPSLIMTEITSGLYPWMNFVESKLDNHSERIKSLENN
ncbi:MAG TPA: hypothetical protein EYN91_10445 [Candidatus Melainabacteria bacterium]|nr:hypothetical protein [Candidatus Melainabacteria bacterium]HIN64294.1 hypothetical protein [Candidatus Obscuribacterales bacterium]